MRMLLLFLDLKLKITSPDSCKMSPQLTVSTTPSGVAWWKLLICDVDLRVNVAAAKKPKYYRV